MIPARVVERLFASLVPNEAGCLVSTYSVGSHGYSQIGWSENGRTQMRLGHRVAWEAERGLIPDDLVVDHVCRNRKCCNVQHLRLLTLRENARLNGQLLRTHCPRGHTYDGENMITNHRGHRECRTCRRGRRR